MAEIVKTHTQTPVPKVLAYSADPKNPVGAEYIIMSKAPGVQLFKKWAQMSDADQFHLVLGLAKLQGQIGKLRFPASGGLYLRESLGKGDRFVGLDQEMDPEGRFCIGPSCERGWWRRGVPAALQAGFNRGPCQ